MKSYLHFLSLFILFTSCTDDKSNYEIVPSEKNQVGKAIFFDTNLSNPIGQACASCHAPEKGFSDPANNAISQGILTNNFGNRNAPSLSYTIFSPSRYYNAIDETFVGGLFLDGRSTSLQEQFIHPLLNPLEMNNTSVHDVAEKIKQAIYFPKLTSIYGTLQSDIEILNAVADAVASYEKSREVNSFTSKFDYYSRQMISFTEDEKKGLALFAGKAQCANCHILDEDENTGKVLFTDFTYDNIGVPKNQTNPFYTQPTSINPAGNNYIDLGIGALVGQAQHNGKFKVPTLRNIAITGPYFHNGSFSTLKQVIHFYNTRDLNTGEFGPAEVPQNVNTEELGNLQLTAEEEYQLEKFLETLTDHYRQ
ncbi:cytochrome-c peroxidase [Flavobacterium sp. N1994]|uniref:cytochrome-c peroxidase n=1 Tax=Flavobacterium sp. N1994 TaxID=2986827 RepID=UPI002221EA54|nr:cytochrome c peroxidase [Flavobacterium sp. N1994]